MALAAAPPIPRADRGSALPLSQIEERLWLAEKMAPGRATYNVICAVRLRGALDEAALAQSVDGLVARHETLRTRFVEVEGRPARAIDAPASVAIRVLDARRAPAPFEETRRLARAAFDTPFDLERDWLLRPALIRVAEDDQVLVLISHHIVVDGAAQEVLLADLAELYSAAREGRACALEPLQVQYADYAAAQRVGAEEAAAALAAYRERLAGIENLVLPTDRPRGTNAEEAGDVLTFTLPPDFVLALRTLGRACHATASTVMLTALAMTLSRYSGQKAFAIGSVVSNRARPETRPVVGCFANTLPIPARVDLSVSAMELVARFQEELLRAYAHPDVALHELASDLALDRTASVAHLVQVLFVSNAWRERSLVFSGLSAERLTGIWGVSVSRFELSLHGNEMPDGSIGCSLQYDPRLFDAATAERMRAQFELCLRQLARASEAPLASLPLLTDADRAALATLNATERATDGAPVHDLVADHAKRDPRATAVVFGAESLDYEALDRAATSVATWLRGKGIRRGDRVAIMVERSAKMVPALLGTLKAGAAYVPVDPALPAERIRYVTEDARTALALTDESLAEALCTPVLPGAPALPRVTARDVAYVLYTSGSTGKPKGVVVAHGALTNFLASMRADLDVTNADVFIGLTTLSFDIAGLEIYLPLTLGARVVIADRETQTDGQKLAELITGAGATVVQATPASWRMLLEAGWSPTSAGPKLLCGGEALRADLAARLLAGGARLFNLYGPTETTIWSSIAEVVADGPITLGAPIANTTLHVLDDRLDHVPHGAIGELFIGGAGLAHGYLGRAELTAERFVPDPFGDRGARLYRTGDFVRWRSDGSLEYLGRRDDQVKIHGFRIELGEIETALASFPEVRAAVVTAVPDALGLPRLVAYVVAAEAPTELAERLGRELPRYMVPSAFVRLDALPLNPSGKVDRKALPPPVFADQGERAEPRNPREEMVFHLFREVLRVERFGIHDDFFALGGHSILATRLVGLIARELHVSLPVRVVFESPTVAAIAEKIGREGGAADAAPLERAARDRPLPLSFAQERYWFTWKMEPGAVAYNLPRVYRLDGPLERARLEESLRVVIARHEVLRSTFAIRDDELTQRATAAAAVTLEALPDGEEAFREALPAFVSRPFDLEGDAPIRFGLSRGAAGKGNDDTHFLALVVHHIAADGPSLDAICREIAAAYTGAELPALHVQYADFAAWQRRSFEAGAPSVGYWVERLADAPAMLDLPTDRPRPAVRQQRGAASVQTALDPELVPAIRRLGREVGVTPFVVLLAAWFVSLARRSGTYDLVVGTPSTLRIHPDLEHVVGDFTNMLPLRARLEGRPSFRELLVALRRTVLDAFDHQSAPFERVVAAINPVRSLGYAPIFQVVLAMREDASPAIDFGPELRCRGQSQGELGTAVDMTLWVRLTEDAGFGTLAFDPDLFDVATAERLVAGLRAVLRDATARPDAHVDELDAMPLDELDRVRGWGLPSSADVGGDLVAAFFATDAARTAAQTPEDARSFGELGTSARRLAGHLAGLGVSAGQRVAIALEASHPFLVSLVGVLALGAVPVLVDPELERGRVAASGAVAAIASRRVRKRLPAGILRVDLESAEREEPRATLHVARAEDPALVLFPYGGARATSPVVLTHGALASAARETAELLELTGADVVLLAAAQTQAAFVRSLFATWSRGASAAILPDGGHRDAGWVLDAIARTRATVVEAPGWMLDGWSGPRLSSVRLVDAVDPQRKPDGVPVVSLAGPPELAACATFDVFEEGRPRPSAGRPTPRTTAAVVDGRGELVPVGVPGELLVGKPPVRTGERVRWMPDGSLERLGRLDAHAQIDGAVVALDEVEAALRSDARVTDVGLAVVPSEGAPPAILAFVVADEAVDLGPLLAEALPEASPVMTRLESVPRDRFGRPDLDAIEAMKRAAAAACYVAPRDAREARLVQAFEELLGRDRVGVHDDFFALGGHSILATRLVGRMARELGVELPVRVVFESPTVAGIAARLDEAAANALPDVVTSTAREHFPLSYPQEAWWRWEMKHPGTSLWINTRTFRLTGPLDVRALEGALLRLVERHEALRTAYVLIDDEPRQAVRPAEPVPFQHDVVSKETAEHEIPRILGAAAEAPFDLSSGRLLRAGVIQTAPEEHIFYLTTHHLAADHASFGVLARDLGLLYAPEGLVEDSATELPALTIHYRDFGLWQRDRLGAEIIAPHVAYWRRRLADATPALLPADAPRPDGRPPLESVVHSVRLSKAELSAVDAAARQGRLTRFVFLLAAVYRMMERETGQRDLVLSVPGLNRPRADFHELVGHFTEYLLLRTTVDRTRPVRELLESIRETSSQALAHDAAPIQLATGSPEVITHPLRRVQLNVLGGGAGGPTMAMRGLTVRGGPVAPKRRWVTLDLNVEVRETGDGLVLALGAAPQVFLPATVERFGAAIRDELLSLADEATRADWT